MPRRPVRRPWPTPLDVARIRQRLLTDPPTCALDLGHVCPDHGLVLTLDPTPATWAQDDEMTGPRGALLLDCAE